MKLNLIKLSTLFFFCFSQVYAQNPIVVGAQRPETKEISDNLELPGTVLSNESVKITSVVSEKIKKIIFQEGKFVQKDELLVELMDDEEYAILAQVNAELDEAKINYERALKLSEKGNISKSLLDNRLMSKKKLSGKVKEIMAKIEDHKIKAPFSGYTGIRNFSNGSFIKPGDVITELHDINTLKIQVYIPEIFSNKIKLDDVFFLEPGINIPKNVSGKIYVIDPVIDKTSRSLKVLGKIKNKNNKIKPGMMVTLKIPLEKRLSFVVRENAILNEDDISYVYLINKKSEVIKKNVEVGIKEDGMIEILKGLTEDDNVIFEGINKIKEGSVVRLK